MSTYSELSKIFTFFFFDNWVLLVFPLLIPLILLLTLLGLDPTTHSAQIVKILLMGSEILIGVLMILWAGMGLWDLRYGLNPFLLGIPIGAGLVLAAYFCHRSFPTATHISTWIPISIILFSTMGYIYVNFNSIRNRSLDYLCGSNTIEVLLDRTFDPLHHASDRLDDLQTYASYLQGLGFGLPEEQRKAIDSQAIKSHVATYTIGPFVEAKVSRLKETPAATTYQLDLKSQPEGISLGRASSEPMAWKSDPSKGQERKTLSRTWDDFSCVATLLPQQTPPNNQSDLLVGEVTCIIIVKSDKT